VINQERESKTGAVGGAAAWRAGRQYARHDL